MTQEPSPTSVPPPAPPPAPTSMSPTTSLAPGTTPVWEIPRGDTATVAGNTEGGDRPEIFVGLAFAGGLATAILLRRLAS